MEAFDLDVYSVSDQHSDSKHSQENTSPETDELIVKLDNKTNNPGSQ
jgi:hypothetical protein